MSDPNVFRMVALVVSSLSAEDDIVEQYEDDHDQRQWLEELEEMGDLLVAHAKRIIRDELFSDTNRVILADSERHSWPPFVIEWVAKKLDEEGFGRHL